MPETPDRDPVVSSVPLSAHLHRCRVVADRHLAWALYDEFFGLRPWKSVPGGIRPPLSRVSAASRFPSRAPRRRPSAPPRNTSSSIRSSRTCKNPSRTKWRRSTAKHPASTQRLSVVTDAYTTARAYVSSQIYVIEHTSQPGEKTLRGGGPRRVRTRAVRAPPASSGERRAVKSGRNSTSTSSRRNSTACAT